MDLETAAVQTMVAAFHPTAVEKYLEGINARGAHV